MSFQERAIAPRKRPYLIFEINFSQAANFCAGLLVNTSPYMSVNPQTGSHADHRLWSC